MKFVRFERDDKISYGVLNGKDIAEISGLPFEKPLIYTKKIYSLEEVKILSPVTPSKIIGIGLNYAGHIREMKDKKPAAPKIFMKPSTSVIGTGEAIIYPVHMSKRVDYEGELGIVIGKITKNVDVEEAKDCIFGYTIVNDVTARDLQRSDGVWTRAKGFDTFCPIGDVVETDVDPLNLHIVTYVNGKIKQDSFTSHMIFNVYELVSYISKIMTLLPGDVIASGTPEGVGPLNAGDEVEISIEGVGTLKNKVESA
ncbi:MAG: fumarylacetoacetate hydrolase family protein [Deltaproteobacteria bacterium]|nr:fumarylacetoacetate hydrolase family protein [Deltaproteobacteria bacterium]